MKVNEAPERIYITNFDIEALPKDEQLSERWGDVRIQDTDIEYTRTDAFIEKACEWLEKNGCGYWLNDSALSNRDLIEEFKKYMEE